MFGKTKGPIDTSLEGPTMDEFFGDEAAADHGVQIDRLRDRVKNVEGQINSQFTSLAAYAQIAHEQIELVRAESRAERERSESRVTQLIERERADRLVGLGQVPGVHPPSDEVESRLTALEDAIDTIKVGINDCLSRQKALADAITSLFEPRGVENNATATLPPPVNDGPIGGLAMHG
ncbi:MAG: hypothetical protein HKN44_14445 [Ilumatobacter sp.]|nr:hypothetical protein [Ilumatobacter sp.]